jgi:hypothetical protein
MIYRPGFLAVVLFNFSPTPSPISKLSLFLGLPACRRLSLLSIERGSGWEGGAKSYDAEKRLAFYKSYNTLLRSKRKKVGQITRKGLKKDQRRK